MAGYPFAIRIGQGYDCHRLVAGRDLVLGGVTVPHDRGLLGHSDADALLHAVIDALLGAAGLKDIGTYFPDSDPRYRGADSRLLLRETLKMVAGQGYAIGNIDATVIAQRPKLAPYIDQMKRNMAEDLAVDLSQVGLKAKTNEGMGALGRQEGIAVFAVALLVKV